MTLHLLDRSNTATGMPLNAWSDCVQQLLASCGEKRADYATLSFWYLDGRTPADCWRIILAARAVMSGALDRAPKVMLGDMVERIVDNLDSRDSDPDAEPDADAEPEADAEPDTDAEPDADAELGDGI